MPWRIFLLNIYIFTTFDDVEFFQLKIPQYLLISFRIASPSECVLFLGTWNICDYHSFPKISKQPASFRYVWRCLYLPKNYYIWSIICSSPCWNWSTSSNDAFVWCSDFLSYVPASPNIWCNWQWTFFICLIMHTKWKPTEKKVLIWH